MFAAAFVKDLICTFGDRCFDDLLMGMLTALDND